MRELHGGWNPSSPCRRTGGRQAAEQAGQRTRRRQAGRRLARHSPHPQARAVASIGIRATAVVAVRLSSTSVFGPTSSAAWANNWFLTHLRQPAPLPFDRWPFLRWSSAAPAVAAFRCQTCAIRLSCRCYLNQQVGSVGTLSPISRLRYPAISKGSESTIPCRSTIPERTSF